MDAFELHPRLATDTFFVSDLELCQLLVMNDAHYPWCILVPRRAGLREIYELDEAEQVQLIRESCLLGKAMMRAFKGAKLNVAALGNVVPQLHIHHIVRFERDAAWPGPVWGKVSARPYDATARRTFTDRLQQHLTAVSQQKRP